MTEQIDTMTLQKQLAGRDVFIVAWGLVYHVVCAPHDMPVEEMLATTNKIDPTGVSSPWVLTSDPLPKDGAFKGTNKLPCPDCATRFHYLVNC